MEVIPIRTTSLGDATYVVTTGTTAVVIDPQRDIGRFLELIDGRTVTHVLETHVHNDYLSGGRELAARTGADLVLPAGAGAGFVFTPAFHLEELASEDGLVVRPIHTPGHTPEHVSYLILLTGAPSAVFTGGSLLVGAAGRSDLLGMEYAEPLSRLQYGSLQRLGQLPDETGVFPTHGEGSFCTASGAGRTTSTIGQEKAENPLYRISDVDEFVRDQLSVLVPYPTYYKHMGPSNRTGVEPMPSVEVPEVDAEVLARHLAEGGAVVDGRSRHAFAESHVPGSIGVELGDSFAPWCGWLLPYDAAVMLVLDDDQDPGWAATELARIGFERVDGVMRGTEEWTASGRRVDQHRVATAAELLDARANEPSLQILDVRDPKEWEAGHIDGSVHRYVPDLESMGLPPDLDASRPVWVICRSGNRASIAAGILQRMGYTPIVVGVGGVPDALDSLALQA